MLPAAPAAVEMSPSIVIEHPRVDRENPRIPRWGQRSHSYQCVVARRRRAGGGSEHDRPCTSTTYGRPVRWSSPAHSCTAPQPAVRLGPLACWQQDRVPRFDASRPFGGRAVGSSPLSVFILRSLVLAVHTISCTIPADSAAGSRSRRQVLATADSNRRPARHRHDWRTGRAVGRFFFRFMIVNDASSSLPFLATSPTRAP